MKLRELIVQLQAVEARVGGEAIVDVGLNHDEDGFCSKPVEFVDAENFEASVILHGGAIELVPGITIPDAYYISREVLAERYRQQSDEGWDAEHDDQHTRGELALAAAVYARGTSADGAQLKVWPWDASWYKPTSRRRDLVKAGALVFAEIERLDRAAARACPVCKAENCGCTEHYAGNKVQS